MSTAPSQGSQNAPHSPAGRPGGRPATADARLPSGPEAVPAFESFIAGVDFLDSRERSVATIVGDEVVDNLVTHSEVGQFGITVRVRRSRDAVLLAVFVESHHGFGEFARRLQAGELPGPRYNGDLRRWHGLGLTMCRNLSRRAVYRAGEKIDRIFIELDPSRRP